MRPRNIPYRVVASLFLLFLLASNPPSYSQMAEEILGKLGSLPQRERQERLIEGAKKEGEITIYLTMSLGDFSLLVKEFKKTYPFLAVKHLRKSGTSLLQIAISEKRANRYFPDVFLGIWSGLWRLMQQQLVGKYNSPENRFYEDHYKDVNGQWTAFQASSRLFAYNTTLVKKIRAPEELLRFTGSVLEG